MLKIEGGGAFSRGASSMILSRLKSVLRRHAIFKERVAVSEEPHLHVHNPGLSF